MNGGGGLLLPEQTQRSASRFSDMSATCHGEPVYVQRERNFSRSLRVCKRHVGRSMLRGDRLDDAIEYVGQCTVPTPDVWGRTLEVQSLVDTSVCLNRCSALEHRSFNTLHSRDMTVYVIMCDPIDSYRRNVMQYYRASYREAIRHGQSRTSRGRGLR